jgi:hypothetical protein
MHFEFVLAYSRGKKRMWFLLGKKQLGLNKHSFYQLHSARSHTSAAVLVREGEGGGSAEPYKVQKDVQATEEF